MALTFRTVAATAGVADAVGVYTTAAVSIGAASADRSVIVLTAVVLQNATNYTLAIGGVSATQVGTTRLLETDALVRAYKATVPTGTTATLTYTGNDGGTGAFFDVDYAVWTEDAGDPTYNAEGFDDTFTSGVLSTTVDVPAGGFTLAISRDNFNSSTATWTGLTENAEAGDRFFTAASDSGMSAETGRTVSVESSGGIIGFQDGLYVVSFTAPAAGGTDALTLSGFTSGTPSVGTASLSQSHSLAATAVTTGSPVAGAATLAQTHSLTASGVASGAPVAGAATLGQVHALTSTALTAGQPIVGSPALASEAGLAAQGIVTASPDVGVAVLAQTHSLTATAVTTGNAIAADATLGQIHSLTANGITSGAVTLGAPTVSQSDAFGIVGITTGQPVLGSPSLAQVHQLTAAPVTTQAPSVASAPIVFTHILDPQGVTLGAWQVGIASTSPLSRRRTASPAQSINGGSIAASNRGGTLAQSINGGTVSASVRTGS